MIRQVAAYGTTKQARQMWSARDAEGLPRDVGFLAPPSYLVSERRKQRYVLAAMQAIGVQ